MPYEIYRKGSMEDGEPIMTVGSGTLVGAGLYSTDLSGADLRKADLSGADLRKADLSGADLTDADLSWADLTDADLSDADLTDADLTGADLTCAYMLYTDLTDADLSGADLTGAILIGTSLSDANLTGATLPNGETFEYFVEHTVPRLLTAGGKPLEEVASSGNWDCHNWDNCPIAVAFRTNNTAGVPEEYRDDAGLFIALFDAGLIPRPVTTGDNQDAV